MKKLVFFAAFLMLIVSFNYAADCPSGYEFQPNSGVGCVQSNCFSIANAHLSYTGHCVCGSSGSIAENPADPNKECYSQNESCPGCVVACVGLDQSCPGEQIVNDLPDTDSEDDSGDNWGEDWGADWGEDWGSEDWVDDDWGPYEWPDLYPDDEAPEPELFPDEGEEPSVDDLFDDYYRGYDDKITDTEIDSDSDFDDEAYNDALSGGVSENFNPDGLVVMGDLNPYNMPGGAEVQDIQDFFVDGWGSFKEWYQGDLPLFGEDGMWNWRSRHVDPNSGDVTEVKWLGGDLQLGWNDGFKTQIYLADVSMPGREGSDGYTIGMGITLEWKDKFKFSVGVPGTPVSVNLVPRDIYNWLGSGVDAIRNGLKSTSIIDNARDLQRRQAEKNNQ